MQFAICTWRAMAARVRADAAAWDEVHFQRRLHPQLTAPRALGPVAPRPSAACGRWQPGARHPLSPPPPPPNSRSRSRSRGPLLRVLLRLIHHANLVLRAHAVHVTWTTCRSRSSTVFRPLSTGLPARSGEQPPLSTHAFSHANVTLSPLSSRPRKPCTR